MTGSRSVNVGRDANGSVITTGDSNRIDVTLDEGRAASDIDMRALLESLSELVLSLKSEDQSKMARALADAEDELARPEPDKSEIGQALERALKYAKGAADFASVSAKLGPHVSSAAVWLGTNWQHLTHTFV